MARRVEENRWNQFLRTILPESGTPQEVVTDDNILEQWRKIVPQNRFGEVSATLGRDTFRSEFERALQDGTLEEFLIEQLSKPNPYTGIYVVRSAPEVLTSAADKDVQALHQPTFLHELLTKLSTFEDELQKSGMPSIFIEEYQHKAAAIRQFIQAAISIGTPEFTQYQQSVKAWEKLLNVKDQSSSRELRLPYEEQSLRILQANKESKPVYTSVTQVLEEIWHLSDSEKEAIEFDTLTPESTKLSVAQGKALFRNILNRIGLTDWEVEETSSSAINVTAQAKKIAFPRSRVLTADSAAFVVAHEFIHVIRGANGAKQDCALLESGMEDYLPTEEGLATLSEMIMGQPFGHRRQVLFAARYYAVAQALKVVKDSDSHTFKARHSIQEIYDELVGFQVDPEDAADLVWRIFRGTSLTRQVVNTGVTYSDGTSVMVAETFTKDAVYFIGQMMMFDTVKAVMPVLKEEMAKKIITSSEDFSDRVLARIGRAIALTVTDQNDQIPSQVLSKEMYDEFTKLGRAALLSILQYYLPGKMTLESLSDPESGWQPTIHRENLIEYSRIFQPHTENLRE